MEMLHFQANGWPLNFSACSGLIGRSWAMLFASAGFKVKLYDIEQRQVTYALDSIR